jgi:hypothetical protein
MNEHETRRPPDERTHVWDDPKNVERLLRVFYLCLAILVVLDFVLDRHVYHPLDRIPAFYALYGFAACWILVVIAKRMRRVLMRDEDYYDGT